MPRTTRASKSTAPSPAPLSKLHSEKAHDVLEKAVEETGIQVDGVDQSAKPSAKHSKGKGRAVIVEPEVVPEPAVFEEEVDVEDDAGKKASSEDRLAKFKELRLRMNQSTQANRKSLIEDHQKSQTTARELARLAKQKKLAENLREKIDASENGTDIERKKNWGWSIEQNEGWEKSRQTQLEKSNFEFDDVDSRAQRTYDRDTVKLKPDLVAYNRQKEAALGLAPGTIVPLAAKSSDGTSALTKRVNQAEVSRALGAMENLYRDGNTLAYGDSKPSEEAIDRVVGKLNEDTERRFKALRKRKAGDDADGDVTYINDANKVFNKKINRYFDKYTTEIRANFERGTAL